MKPIIPMKLTINSQQAYCSFAKYYPKTVRKLELKSGDQIQLHHFHHRQNQKPFINSKVKTDFFIRQSQRLKGLGTLDINECQPFIQHKSEKFDLMMKKLSNIRGLSCSVFPTKQATRYFQHDQKKLVRTFRRLEVISHHQTDAKQQRHYYHKPAFAAPNIKSTKTRRSPYPATLKNVQITLSDGNFTSQLFERLPRKASKICIYPGQAAVKAILDPPSFKTSFSDYPYLESFEILLPIQPVIHASILNSISYPDSLTCLRLNIHANNNDLMISALQESLNRFKKLKHVALKFSDPLVELKILAPLEENSLESLEVMLSKVCEQNLIEISSLLAKQPNLKHLSLKSSWTATNLHEPWEKLMSQIALLTHCEKLYLNLKVQPTDDKSVKYPFSTLFKNKKLQELHLDLQNGYASSDIGSLMKAIQASSPNLRILELYLSDKVKLVGDDRMNFIQALEGMPFLKTILLDSLTIEGEGCVKKLLEAISRLHHLKSLKLLKLNGQILMEELLCLIEQIITKPGFEEFYFWGEIHDKSKSLSKIIDLRDAFKKNPELKVFEIPFAFFRNLSNLEQFQKYKWNL